MAQRQSIDKILSKKKRKEYKYKFNIVAQRHKYATKNGLISKGQKYAKTNKKNSAITCNYDDKQLQFLESLLPYHHLLFLKLMRKIYVF